MGNRLFKSVRRSDRKEPMAYGVRYLAEGKTVPSKSSKLKVRPEDENSGLQSISEESDGLCMGNGLDQVTSTSPPTTPEGDGPWVGWLNKEYPFENVVMSGGGSKGYAYIGALKALEDCGALSKVKRVGGSSAGAICGGLLAVGCSPQEIADVFEGDIQWLFHDQKCQCCCCLPLLCSKYGVTPAKRFQKIYGEHIARKTGNPDLTFAQLYKDYGREFCVAVTNLNRMCSEYCNVRTTPNLTIRKAVRMSMSFPLVYQAVKEDLNGTPSLYLDGGMLDQYPVHCFDGPDFELNHNTKGAGTEEFFNDKTLGLYVVSETAMDYKIWKQLFGTELPCKPTYLPDTKLARVRLKEEIERRKKRDKGFSRKNYKAQLKSTPSFSVPEHAIHYDIFNKSHVDISNFGQYFITAIETLLVSQRKLHVKPQDANRTVAINCGYVGTNDYVIEPADREFMIRQGYAHTRGFLQNYYHEEGDEDDGVITFGNPWTLTQERSGENEIEDDRKNVENDDGGGSDCGKKSSTSSYSETAV